MLNRLVLGLVVAFGFVMTVNAQDDSGTSKLDKRTARMAKAMMAKFSKAKLSEEQMKEAKAIFMKHAEELMAAQKALDAVNSKIQKAIASTLSDDQQKMMAKGKGKKKRGAKVETVSVAINLPNMT